MHVRKENKSVTYCMKFLSKILRIIVHNFWGTDFLSSFTKVLILKNIVYELYVITDIVIKRNSCNICLSSIAVLAYMRIFPFSMLPVNNLCSILQYSTLCACRCVLYSKQQYFFFTMYFTLL